MWVSLWQNSNMWCLGTQITQITQIFSVSAESAKSAWEITQAPVPVTYWAISDNHSMWVSLWQNRKWQVHGCPKVRFPLVSQSVYYNQPIAFLRLRKAASIFTFPWASSKRGWVLCRRGMSRDADARSLWKCSRWWRGGEKYGSNNEFMKIMSYICGRTLVSS